MSEKNQNMCLQPELDFSAPRVPISQTFLEGEMGAFVVEKPAPFLVEEGIDLNPSDEEIADGMPPDELSDTETTEGDNHQLSALLSAAKNGSLEPDSARSDTVGGGSDVPALTQKRKAWSDATRKSVIINQELYGLTGLLHPTSPSPVAVAAIQALHESNVNERRRRAVDDGRNPDAVERSLGEHPEHHGLKTR